MTVADTFTQQFGAAPAGVWSGPGRVNLIGEHTDYNDGFVLPFALDRTATVAVRLRTDGRIRCLSRQRPTEPVDVAMDSLAPGSAPGWGGYVLGVAWALAGQGVPVPGFELLLDSDVPVGAGLSSSAAIETATALALTQLLNHELAPIDLAMLCHRAETGFAGVPVGIMDQVVSACATAEHALLVDCRSLDTAQVPFRPQDLDCALLVIDTRAAHANVDGAYAERRDACERAAAALGLKALRDASPADVADQPRARHVVTECARVLAAVEALRGGDAPGLGVLLLASHASLRDDFEVSIPELDLAVDAAVAAGAHGARLTGAGFGGCAIALVPATHADDVTEAVTRAFADRHLRRPDIFSVSAGPGATRVA